MNRSETTGLGSCHSFEQRLHYNGQPNPHHVDSQNAKKNTSVTVDVGTKGDINISWMWGWTILRYWDDGSMDVSSVWMLSLRYPKRMVSWDGRKYLPCGNLIWHLAIPISMNILVNQLQTWDLFGE